MRSGIAAARLEPLREPVEHDAAAWRGRVGIDVSRPSRTNARSTRATFSGSSSCSSDRGARSASARAASANASPSRCSVPSSPRMHEPGVDEPLHAPARPPAWSSPVSACTASIVVAPSTSAANDAPAVVVGEQADQLPGVERRFRHGDSVARHGMEPLDFDGVERVARGDRPPRRRRLRLRGHRSRTLTDAGIEVTYCIVTDGDAGGAETGMPRVGDGAAAPRGADRGGRGGRRARPALPRLSRRPASSRRSTCAATSPA